MLWSSSVCSDNCYSQSWNWLEMCFLTLPSFIHPLLFPMFSNLFLTFSKHQDTADIWVQGHDIELLSQLMQSFDYGNCYFPKDIQLTIETLQNFIGKINQEDTKSQHRKMRQSEEVYIHISNTSDILRRSIFGLYQGQHHRKVKHCEEALTVASWCFKYLRKVHSQFLYGGCLF